MTKTHMHLVRDNGEPNALWTLTVRHDETTASFRMTDAEVASAMSDFHGTCKGEQIVFGPVKLAGVGNVWVAKMREYLELIAAGAARFLQSGGGP